MTADFCDVGLNDSAQTIQTILIFVQIALSVTDWGAKVFLVPLQTLMIVHCSYSSETMV